MNKEGEMDKYRGCAGLFQLVCYLRAIYPGQSHNHYCSCTHDSKEINRSWSSANLHLGIHHVNCESNGLIKHPSNMNFVVNFIFLL